MSAAEIAIGFLISEKIGVVAKLVVFFSCLFKLRNLLAYELKARKGCEDICTVAFCNFSPKLARHNSLYDCRLFYL